LAFLFGEIGVLSINIIAHASHLEYDVDYNSRQRGLLVIFEKFFSATKLALTLTGCGFFYD
jgi:hypothetical protein